MPALSPTDRLSRSSAGVASAAGAVAETRGSLGLTVEDDAFQSEEELAAHYGPDGPVAAALQWLDAIFHDDLRAAWAKTEPNLRLVLAQAFLWANRTHPHTSGYDLDEGAAALAGLSFDHDLWPSFEATQLREFHEAFDAFFSEPYGAASRPRPVGLDFEIVKFVRTESDEPEFVVGPTLVEAQVFLLRATSDGWLVAGQGVDAPPEPGWPPTPGHPTF